MALFGCRPFVRCHRRLKTTTVFALLLLLYAVLLLSKAPNRRGGGRGGGDGDQGGPDSLPWNFDHEILLLADDRPAAGPPSAANRPPLSSAAAAAANTTEAEVTSGNQTVPSSKLGSRATPKPTEPHACPKTTSAVARHSRWFGARFRPKAKLFLDPADADNKTSLYRRELPYGFKGQNLTVLRQILGHENFTNPPIPGDGEAARRPACLRCAVVGSGGVLNGSRAGREIDAHDYVFRVNQAATRGYAEDVGRRTTFYTFFPESQQLEEIEDKNMVALYIMYRTYDVNYVLETMRQDRSQWPGTVNKMKMPVLDPGKLKIFNPGFLKYVLEAFLDNKARPTTGSIVVVAALHLCDEVDIYGFGYDPKFSLHYYDPKFVKHTRQSTMSHNVQNERRLWDKLHAEGVIRLFKRDV